MTTPERLISEDLAELGRLARSGPRPALPAALATLSLPEGAPSGRPSGPPDDRDTSPYRDDATGAALRRDQLLAARQRQLALAPLTLAHVFANRVARASAGAVALISAAVVGLLLVDPLALLLASWLVPGIGAVDGLALAALAMLTTYLVSLHLAQGFIARRMRALVNASADAHADLERLARGPVQELERLVRKADRWATTLPVAGGAALATVGGYAAISLALSAHAWDEPAAIYHAQVGRGVSELVLALAVMLAMALRLGEVCAREPRRGELPCWARWLSRWWIVPLSLVLGLLTLTLGVELVVFGWSFPVRIAGAGLTCAAATLPIAWATLWWRGREQDALAVPALASASAP